VLESKNPKTGKLYTLADLNGLPRSRRKAPRCLEDGLFAGPGAGLAATATFAMRFHRPRRTAAGSTGRDHGPGVARTSSSRNGTRRSRRVIRLWQMNEINKLDLAKTPRGSGS